MKIATIPEKDPAVFYKMTIYEYSDLSKAINDGDPFPSICEYPSIGMNTKYGRIATMGITRNQEYYSKKVMAVRTMAEPFYPSKREVELTLIQHRGINQNDYYVLYDLLSTGVAALPDDISTFLQVTMFCRIQKLLSDDYDLLLRGCWPCYEGDDDVIVYIDQDYVL